MFNLKKILLSFLFFTNISTLKKNTLLSNQDWFELVKKGFINNPIIQTYDYYNSLLEEEKSVLKNKKIILIIIKKYEKTIIFNEKIIKTLKKQLLLIEDSNNLNILQKYNNMDQSGNIRFYEEHWKNLKDLEVLYNKYEK